MKFMSHVRDFPEVGLWCGIMRGAENTITTIIKLGLSGGIMRGAGNTITTSI
jgi:hypothetical protein